MNHIFYFTPPVLYPETTVEQVDLSILDHTGVIVIYYYTDSTGKLVGFRKAGDQYGNIDLMGNLQQEIPDVLQPTVYEKHKENKSYIISLVMKEKYVEKDNLGVFKTEYEGRDFPEGYKKSKLNVAYVQHEPELLTEFTTFQEFDGNDAEMIFKYGEVNYVTVYSPAGNFVRNKPVLPKPELGTATSSRLAYSENTYNEDQFAFEFEEKTGMSAWSDFANQAKSFNFGSELNIGRDYILNIKIKKDCGSYFLSENGWKIYGCSNAMTNLLKKKVGSSILGAVDKICFEVCLLETNGKYELVLKAKNFEYKSSYSIF